MPYETTPPFVARSVQLRGSAGRVMDLATGVRRPFELRIDEAGVAVLGPGGVTASWVEIADVYILRDVRRRFLVYRLTPEGARLRGHLRGTWRVASLLGAPQPSVLLDVLDRDEIEVLDAVRLFSDGRYPTRERVLGGRERGSTPWP